MAADSDVDQPRDRIQFQQATVMDMITKPVQLLVRGGWERA